MNSYREPERERDPLNRRGEPEVERELLPTHSGEDLESFRARLPEIQRQAEIEYAHHRSIYLSEPPNLQQQGETARFSDRQAAAAKPPQPKIVIHPDSSEEKEKPSIQTKTDPSPADPAFDLGTRLGERRGQGQTLPPEVHTRLERQLGASLPRIVIHTDSQSHDFNQALGAKAFTTGHDIFFSNGAYKPDTEEGQRLLTHEATHVLQQMRGPVDGKLTEQGIKVSDPSDAFEQEATANETKPAEPAQPEFNPNALLSQVLETQDPLPLFSHPAWEVFPVIRELVERDEQLARHIAPHLAARRLISLRQMGQILEGKQPEPEGWQTPEDDPGVRAIQCRADSVAQPVARASRDEEEPVIQRLAEPEARPDKQGWVQHFVGLLEDEVPIHLHLEREGNTLTGYSSGTSERTEDSFSLKGFITDGVKLVILEAKDSSGKLVRTFQGAFSQEGGNLVLEGVWNSTDSQKPSRRLHAVADKELAAIIGPIQGSGAEESSVRWSRSRHFAGTIEGRTPVHFSLQREGNTLSGYSSGTPERGPDSFTLSGFVSSDAKLVTLEAKDANGNTVRTFQGSFTDARGKRLEGEWVRTDSEGGGRRLSVVEGEVPSTAPPSARQERRQQPQRNEENGETAGLENQPPDALDALMGFSRGTPRYTVEQIRQARDLIAQEKDEDRRGDLYLSLQGKVQYRNQRNNASRGRQGETIWGRDYTGKAIGDAMCNLTSLAMALEAIGIGNPDSDNYPQYEDYLEHKGRELFDTARSPRRFNRESSDLGGNSVGWPAVARALGAKVTKIVSSQAKRTRQWWEENVLPELRTGNSVMFSITGHIVRLQGMTEDGLVVDDPFGGTITLTGNSYYWRRGLGNATDSESKNGARGEDNVWPWKQVENHTMFWVAVIAGKQ